MIGSLCLKNPEKPRRIMLFWAELLHVLHMVRACSNDMDSKVLLDWLSSLFVWQLKINQVPKTALDAQKSKRTCEATFSTKRSRDAWPNLEILAWSKRDDIDFICALLVFDKKSNVSVDCFSVKHRRRQQIKIHRSNLSDIRQHYWPCRMSLYCTLSVHHMLARLNRTYNA